ncbi:MAG: type II secretion system F family protein [Meiothermus sp.]|uniref:type II secretion system F family protein n=1 Tax=Meiothermus sp. TaxID=1955249 RepID=UPI0025E6A84D|nr:type II secretion system F family protein [Meiothermus sp.]MCS7058871.1 type II secretion system F family protein [Meiothermus sp.]MCS7194903.1 type II secretion system F family protein [Meiothermus sp.]MCX7741603.1 type II secretion system F family protein [Meiothermus sp.]MDW8091288.1 type II secretion system F family protein [Meiothermus sp.]MDW8482530.1 type II secretion system F family protein [Meiothermus sp.]
MPAYQYKARDRQGRLISAVIEADDIRTAARVLREKGLFIAEIKEPGRGLQAEIKLTALEPKPGLKDLAIFSRQLATMLGAGLPIVQALAILEKQTEKRKFQEILRDVRLEVEGGANFSEALSRHKLFNRLYINLVRAGETSGSLDTILDRLATFQENELALIGKIRSALTYPAIVFVFAIGVTYFLLTTIVPQFAQILTGLGSELPLLTRALMAISDFLRQSSLFLLLLAVGLYFAYRSYYRTDRGRRQIDQIKLRLPIFGNLVKKSALARFSRTFSLLISSGVNIVEALDITKGTAGNAIVEDILEQTKVAIQAGEPVYATLQAHPQVFPPMVGSMVAIGEETGALDTMLTKIADFYEREVDEAVSALTAAIEPLMIIFLGVVVGVIVAGMFLPLFRIIGTLSQQ